MNLDVTREVVLRFLGQLELTPSARNSSGFVLAINNPPLAINLIIKTIHPYHCGIATRSGFGSDLPFSVAVDTIPCANVHYP